MKNEKYASEETMKKLKPLYGIKEGNATDGRCSSCYEHELHELNELWR